MGAGLFVPLLTRTGSAERADSLGQAAKLARGGVLVQHATGNAARQFRLHGLKRGRGRFLVTGGKRGFHLLHQGADPADAGAIDGSATFVAADAPLGLRRLGPLESPVVVKI